MDQERAPGGESPINIPARSMPVDLPTPRDDSGLAMQMQHQAVIWVGLLRAAAHNATTIARPFPGCGWWPLCRAPERQIVAFQPELPPSWPRADRSDIMSSGR